MEEDRLPSLAGPGELPGDPSLGVAVYMTPPSCLLCGDEGVWGSGCSLAAGGGDSALLIPGAISTEKSELPFLSLDLAERRASVVGLFAGPSSFFSFSYLCSEFIRPETPRLKAKSEN